MSYKTKDSPTVPTVKGEAALSWDDFHAQLRAIAWLEHGGLGDVIASILQEGAGRHSRH